LRAIVQYRGTARSRASMFVYSLRAMRYLREVAVIGTGKTAFGVFPGKDLRTLAVEAGRKALENARTEPAAVEAFYLGNFAGPEFTGQNHLAPYVSASLGMTGIPSTRFEAACASSGAAFFQAFMGVASGIYDVVMVVGVEKMTCQPTARVTEILAGAGDCATEVKAGSTFPSLFAMIAPNASTSPPSP
jgi:acetyl-CoA C-acetyltransferase